MSIRVPTKTIGAFLLFVITGCGGQKMNPVTPEQRMLICEACQWTGSTEPGYLASLKADEIRMLENGEKRFKCPSCGEPAAHPIMTEPPPPETTP